MSLVRAQLEELECDAIVNSKNIGDLGEYVAITFLLSYGVNVYKSVGDNSPSDFIIDINNELLKIQVKTSNVKSDKNKTGNVIIFPMCSSQVHRGKDKKRYSVKEVDYFIFYSPLHNKLLIYKNNGKEYSVVIRFNENTRQKKNVKFAKDFLLSDFLEKNGYNKLYWSE